MNNSVSRLGGGLSSPDRACWSVHCDLGKDTFAFSTSSYEFKKPDKMSNARGYLGLWSFHLEQLVIIPVALNSMITSESSYMFLTAHFQCHSSLGMSPFSLQCLADRGQFIEFISPVRSERT